MKVSNFAKSVSCNAIVTKVHLFSSVARLRNRYFSSKIDSQIQPANLLLEIVFDSNEVTTPLLQVHHFEFWRSLLSCLLNIIHSLLWEWENCDRKRYNSTYNEWTTKSNHCKYVHILTDKYFSGTFLPLFWRLLLEEFLQLNFNFKVDTWFLITL